ncbi:MAG: hypothetical protein ACTHLX_05555, partial [Candidatus Binatia bacterium]
HWPPYSAEESDSRMDVTSKMTKRKRNNDAIQRTKIFPFVLQRLFTKEERIAAVLQGLACMHSKNSRFLTGLFVLKSVQRSNRKEHGDDDCGIGF